MSDESDAALEDADEVVQPAKKRQAAEEPKSTEGQDNDQPAEDDGDEPEAEEQVSEAKKRRERRKAQNRQLREQLRDAETKAQQAQERLDRIEEASKQQKPPKEADFDDYQEYLVASGAWHAGREMDRRSSYEIQREAETHKKSISELQERQQREAREIWESQAVEARKRYADFDKVVSAPDLTITDTMAAIIRQADVGADVAYFLGTNPATAREISSLSPTEQAYEMGLLSNMVTRPRARTQSSAPDPVAPVRPKSSSGAKDPAKMTMSEYAAARKAGKL